ncbi:MAG TPA: hypothetical protein PKW35_11520 [Nannocystaceae bacterium]|nr:hypothetical protein [Nannocystaceae bacterium]
MRTSHVPIESPCHESWEAMEGDAERRFCGVCEKHVHDLSAMRYDDAVAPLRESAGEHLCVRYSAEADGALRFRDLIPRSRLTRGIRRAAFAAVLLAACGPKIEAPVPEIAEVIVDRITHATETTPDGGCKFATGPFTTFHFPPGHAFCGPVDHAAGAAPASPVAPLTGPGPSEPAVDPITRPTMGEAIADPGPVDPFVPCDPKVSPHYVVASPSKPGVMPRPEPQALMGDVAMPEPAPSVQGGLRANPPAPLPQPGFAPPPPRPSPQPGFVAPPPPPHPAPDPFPGQAYTPPSPPPDPFPGSGYAPPPTNRAPWSPPPPPPTPNPFPGAGDSRPLPPPPPDTPPPLMGSVSPTVDTLMGRRAPPR